MSFDWYPNYAVGQALLVASDHQSDNLIFDAVGMNLFPVGVRTAALTWLFTASAGPIAGITSWLSKYTVTTHSAGLGS